MAPTWPRREFLAGLAAGAADWPGAGRAWAIASPPHNAGPTPRFRRLSWDSTAPSAAALAAGLLAETWGLPRTAAQPAAEPVPGPGVLVLASGTLSPAQRAWWEQSGSAGPPAADGYRIRFRSGGALLWAQRPRALLYAAGDQAQWRAHPEGDFARQPAFALRSAGFGSAASVARAVATLGINLVVGGGAAVTLRESFPQIYARLPGPDRARLERAQELWRARTQNLAAQCQAADVPYYPFLYGNNFALWSPALYRAALEAYPIVRGESMPHSWEKGTLCPSQPQTWDILNAYIHEYMERAGGAGLYTTFWDHFGLFCQNAACRRSGLNKFPNELYVNVKNYYETLHAMGKRLVVRTWSSGCPHWLGDQYVHAPGYGHFGGSDLQLWGRVIHELPEDIILQTKVYNSDCEPNPPYSPFIGQAGRHKQIAEYQIVGQTTGRFYLPASCVSYNARTLRFSRRRLPASGGISVSAGGTFQRDYSLFDDLCNGINLYAWRRSSWDLEVPLARVWREWADAHFGPAAAPYIIRALQLSEPAVNGIFSPLGLGSDTNSNFAPNIARREALLMYTNRFFLPRYARYLEPTRENIARVAAQKRRCLARVNAMLRQLARARPHLSPAQYGELATRFDWLHEVAICRAHLDESLWRYRYLRHLGLTLLTTDPDQMRPLALSYDAVHAHAPRLFQYRPGQRFSCYSVPLGRLPRRPSLGSPLPLMNELYAKSRALVEGAMGPHRIPAAWLRPVSAAETAASAILPDAESSLGLE